MKISAAFQGEPGAFSFSAAHRLLGDDVVCQARESFIQVFDAIEQGTVNFGVVPIENTLYGSVHENYDHLLRYGFTICGETTLRIEHALITKPGTNPAGIRRAFSHPVALEQCRLFFQAHPEIHPTPYYDTAGSVKMLMEHDYADAAAIASAEAAPIYGAEILQRGIEDNQGNFTRFFLLTKQPQSLVNFATAAAPSKTSIVFTTANSPGSLVKTLDCFASRNLNLIKLESRPLRDSPWEYLFYLDISGSTDDAVVQAALKELAGSTSFLKILGSYFPLV